MDQSMKLLRIGETDFAVSCHKLISIGLVAPPLERAESYQEGLVSVEDEKRVIAVCLDGMDAAVNIDLMTEENARKTFEAFIEEFNEQEEEGYPESPTMGEEE
jgi:hypothetical protein